MTREKTDTDIRIDTLCQKREDLILKVLGNLYKGKINQLFWNNKGNLCKAEIINGKTWYHPFVDLQRTREEILKNIHAVAEKFNEYNPESLEILEYLLNKIDEGFVAKTEEQIQADVREIKERCGSILMLLSIEGSNN
jgi:hypothetical protein